MFYFVTVNFTVLHAQAKMATVHDLPVEIVRKILLYLNTRDEMAAIEASPLFDRASLVQIEISTNFRVRDGKNKFVA